MNSVRSSLVGPFSLPRSISGNDPAAGSDCLPGVGSLAGERRSFPGPECLSKLLLSSLPVRSDTSDNGLAEGRAA